MRHRNRSLIFALLLLICQGCAPLATYGENRVRDLSDVVDVRYGTGFGLGISAQFGEYIGTGLGCSVEWSTRQWFGRKSVEVRDGLFAGGLLVAFDGDYVRRLRPGEWTSEGSSTTGSLNVVCARIGRGPGADWVPTEAWYTEQESDLPGFQIGRLGGAVFLPGIHGGLYLNVGEAIDFVCGLVTGDPMHDDGYPKFFTPDSTATPPEGTVERALQDLAAPGGAAPSNALLAGFP